MIRRKWDSRITRINAEFEQRMQDIAQDAANAIASAAKARVPVDSGDLRDAIHVEVEPDGFAVVAGTDDVFYGHMVENGTVRQPPRPFLTPATEAERDNIERNVRDALRKL